LDIQVHPNSAALFAISVISSVGDGASTLFWTDRWLHGQSLSQLAPDLISLVPNKFLNSWTVRDALYNLQLVRDIKGGVHVQALLEFLRVWDMLQEIQLLPGVPDHHVWTPSASGIFSSRSAYARFFEGAVKFEPCKRMWKSWAPPRCKFFLWLATLNRCWTDDRLARRGLDHPDKCHLCDQEEESAQHLLVSCVFARDIWFQVLSMIGWQQLTPDQNAIVFQDWWGEAESRVDKQQRKGFNSLVILVAWWLWKHRNECVFDSVSPSCQRIIRDIKDDATRWCLAGASRLSSI